MKKILIIVLLLLGIICRVSAGEGKTDTLSKMETSILGVDYSNQKIEQRLNRLEEYVYGHTKTGNNNERLKHLTQDLNADVIGQEVKPTTDTLADVETELPADNSVDYPVLKDVEKKLSIPSKQNQSLHSRLVAIEQKMFNSVYDTDDFYTRVERIKQKMYGGSDRLAYNDNNEISIPDVYPDGFSPSDYNDNDFLSKHNFYKRNSTSSSNEYKLSALEQKILKNTYPDENNNDRLARLENCVFDTEFYYDNEQDRLTRLESAINAKRTASKYDNNKFQQRLNAALQIGTMILMVLACIL